MEYTKVKFKISPISELAQEILMAELAQFAFDSFEETEYGLNAYIPTHQYHLEEVKSIQLLNNKEYSISFDAENIPDQNWNETWEKNYFNPIVIDKRCVVKSPFHTNVPTSEYEILIEPKMAFGTGHHETTGLMIKHILEMDIAGKSILDMGCGTGILGILAAQKKAKKVLGIDIEEWAYNNVRDNIKMNHIDQMEVQCGNASLLDKETFDIIMANINRNILLNDISKYVKVLNKGGILLLSGFYQSDIEIIEKECNVHNLVKKSVKEDNQWVALAYIKAD
ncbi:50S ribosomal protein L11 methyltransferase [Saccharicrinis fermentans]|uniref:Ribosomal protein L11 methyltransferase n=1 Tax=Saccharicrinis fermentans DSM 9555 = JCM 21142 TaxID=869213 RepID=W7Y735_9BACT|nr:50S ribosomal protein L11 methyltransferase [Saccharicrinis fermentans]GAF03483.1 ribosomal protein L11 methyltransferase [Saccharicrinis fermentans DSM 9555 = JCM 21142]